VQDRTGTSEEGRAEPGVGELDAPGPSPSDSKQKVLRLEAELAAARAALKESEDQLLELRERRSLEFNRLERQVYWLERYGIDLDVVMRRKAVRALFTILRVARRGARKLRARRVDD
jgi:hypothetical protein